MISETIANLTKALPSAKTRALSAAATRWG